LPSGQGLTLIANNIGQHGAVSIEPVSTSSAKLYAWALTYGGPQKTIQLQRLQNVSKLGTGDLTYSNYTLTLNGNAVPDRTIGVRLEVPTGTQVTLYVNGKLVRSGQVTNSIMVQNGEVVQAAFGYDNRATLLQTSCTTDDVIIADCGEGVVLGCLFRSCTFSDNQGNSCSITFGVCQDGYAWLDDSCFDF